MVLGWLLVACFVGPFVAQIDTDVAQSVPQVQLNFVHHLGLEKTPSGCPGQVDFPFGQVTFSSSLPDGQGPRQGVRQLKF